MCKKRAQNCLNFFLSQLMRHTHMLWQSRFWNVIQLLNLCAINYTFIVQIAKQWQALPVPEQYIHVQCGTAGWQTAESWIWGNPGNTNCDSHSDGHSVPETEQSETTSAAASELDIFLRAFLLQSTCLQFGPDSDSLMSVWTLFRYQ